MGGRRRRRRTWWLTPADRLLVEGRLRGGESPRQIAAVFGCHPRTVWRVRDAMWLRRRQVTDSVLRLSFEERQRIALGVAAGQSDAEIARRLGRHRSTVGREVRRCGGRARYQAARAQRHADRLARRPKVGKLAGSPELLAEVEAGLLRCLSPQQISATLRVRHPFDRGMQISAETIYHSLYVQARGELRRELCARLRTGRTRRQVQGQREYRGRIKDMVMIAERPPEVDDRRVPGHWEGDLLLGARSQSAVLTLVERQSRYVMLAALEDQSSVHVTDVLAQRIGALPEHLARSVTWDQGKELALHKQFTAKTGIAVYFCDPRSPWQRGSNENTNGLLRQYLPKNSDLSSFSQAQLDEIAAELNYRPRQTLGWHNPADQMAALLGQSAQPFAWPPVVAPVRPPGSPPQRPAAT